MKIGVLTYYGDLNCGTNLQAFATFSAIRKVYPNDTVMIIPFHGFKPEVRPYKSLNPASIYRDLIRIWKYADFKRIKLNIKHSDPIIKDVCDALKYITAFGFDKIYVGADTLLELDRVDSDGLSAYWLKDVDADKILIAASAKNVTYENLTPLQRDEMAEAVSQFKYIGIRDSATTKLFLNFVPAERIHHVPDPTFTLDIDYEITRKYLIRKKLSIPSRSVLIHFYGDDIWADDIARHLKFKGYTIVSPRPYKYSDIVINDMGPLEQFGIYRHFELVITHRFHDGVFCLKNNTPFLLYVKSKKTLMTSDNDSKHISLLKDFGLFPYGFLGCVDDGISVNGFDEKFEQLKSKFDKGAIHSKLQELKAEYIDFLNQTI